MRTASRVNVSRLRSAKHKTGRRYVGSCENVEDRLGRHNAGHPKATQHGIPWILVHGESFANRAQAVGRERAYKTGRGREELDRRIR